MTTVILLLALQEGTPDGLYAVRIHDPAAPFSISLAGVHYAYLGGGLADSDGAAAHLSVSIARPFFGYLGAHWLGNARAYESSHAACRTEVNYPAPPRLVCPQPKYDAASLALTDAGLGAEVSLAEWLGVTFRAGVGILVGDIGIAPAAVTSIALAAEAACGVRLTVGTLFAFSDAKDTGIIFGISAGISFHF